MLPGDEAAARAPLAVEALRAIRDLDPHVFRRHLARLFPLLTSLICVEHTVPAVQRALADVFLRCIGPLLQEAPA